MPYIHLPVGCYQTVHINIINPTTSTGKPSSSRILQDLPPDRISAFLKSTNSSGTCSLTVDAHTCTAQNGQCRLKHVEWRWVQSDPKLMGLGIAIVLVLAVTSWPMWINEYPQNVAAEEWKPLQVVIAAGLPKASAGNITTNSQNIIEYNMQYTSIILCCLHCNPSEAQHSLYIPPGLIFSNATFCLHSVCIYMFCVDPRTNSDYFPIQHQLTCFYNRNRVRLLRCTDWVFLPYSVRPNKL